MEVRKTLSPIRLSTERELRTIVENRRAYTLNHCELNIFETYQSSTLVPLRFEDLVVTSMLRGKKVMHLFNKPGFDYLPGETVIVPASIQMLIDFPEASLEHPTQCIALAVDKEQIVQTMDYLNERYPLENGSLWSWNVANHHFVNNMALSAALHKLISIGISHDLHKDILADLTLKEMLVLIMQTQHLALLDEGKTWEGGGCMRYVVEYIRTHLSDQLSIDLLSAKAGMSKPVFFRSFKRELGISPAEFVIRERIRLAKSYLAKPQSSIKEACFASGFNSLAYFNRIFKKHEGITPGAYQLIS